MSQPDSPEGPTGPTVGDARGGAASDPVAPQPGRPAPPAPQDDAADTQMFRAFVERDEPERPKAVGAPFRIATLLIGLLVFAGLVYLLLQL